MIQFLIQTLAGFTGAVCFAVLFGVGKDKLLYSGLGGVIAWVVYSALGLVIPSDIIRYVITSALFTLYAEILAQRLKTPTTVFIVPSAVPLFPGSLLYYTMEAAVSKNWAVFGEKGVHTLVLAVCISAGILCTTSVFHAVSLYREEKEERGLRKK